jgi:hypothetical protein
MEVEGWKKKRLRRLPTFDPRLERPNKLTKINFEGFLNSLFACASVMTFLMSSPIKTREITQWHGENKEVERPEKLSIVIGRNVKQDNSPGPWGLIATPSFESANRELCRSAKEGVNRMLSIKRPVMTAGRRRNYLGIHAGKSFEKLLDAAV